MKTDVIAILKRRHRQALLLPALIVAICGLIAAFVPLFALDRTDSFW